MADIEMVSRAYGLSCEAPTGGGSHYTISAEGVGAILTIPARRPVKPVYIRLFVHYIARHAQAEDQP
jgi:hypothetical protein